MLDPLDPLSAIVRPPTTRETHLAKKCLPMLELNRVAVTKLAATSPQRDP